MRKTLFSILALGALALTAPVQAQDAAPEGGPKVGDMAPDFSLPASTKDGVTPMPVRLSDFRGQTDVLAIFPKARTGG